MEYFPNQEDTSKSKNMVSKIVHGVHKVWQNLTIEPALFLLAFAGGMSTSTGNQLLIYKTCRVDFNQSDTTCHNLLLPKHEHLNEAITDKAGFLFVGSF